ncbi:hypothetical protein M3Y99_01214300 [Aphelenchoides fujianensis]|nr:hypothetical protein M3Y99_01214300 [Aphelenchoides fujianensis]
MNYGDGSGNNGLYGPPQPMDGRNMQMPARPQQQSSDYGMPVNPNAHYNSMPPPIHRPPNQQPGPQYPQFKMQGRGQDDGGELPMQHNPRKCSTIVSPDQLRQQQQQQMMPPPQLSIPQRPQSMMPSPTQGTSKSSYQSALVSPQMHAQPPLQQSPHTLHSPMSNGSGSGLMASPQQPANVMHSPQQPIGPYGGQMQTSPNMNPPAYPPQYPTQNTASTVHPYVGLQDCSPPSQRSAQPAARFSAAPVQSNQYERAPMFANRSPQQPSASMPPPAMPLTTSGGQAAINPAQNAQFSTPNGAVQMPSQTAGHSQQGMAPAAHYGNSHQAPPGDLYTRPRPDQQHDPQQPHTWRKASLACNFRLNPSTRKDSTSPQMLPTNEAGGGSSTFGRPSGGDSTGGQKMTANENEPPPLRKLSYHPQNSENIRRPGSLKPSGGFNEKYRSQSLSAAEFLRRHGGEGGGGAHGSHSLRRFNSQLRTHRFSTAGLNLNSASGSVYTPPPMLSPMRVGTGLYRSISRQERKISSLALSLKRMDGDAQPNAAGAKAETPTITTTAPPADSALPKSPDENRTAAPVGRKPSGRGLESESLPAKPTSTYPIDIEQARATLTGRKPFIRPPMDNRANAPQRKNGLFLSCATQGTDGSAFAAELELLRKESASSTASTNQENNPSRRMSIIRNSKLSITNDEEVLRKLSTSSTDEPTRKLSSTSDTYYDYVGLDSDITPHINLGKPFQARVKKWSAREVSKEERDQIPDRDDMVFDCKVIEHIPPRAVAAYEALACSQAVPRPGRNKELALHILMENQGNLQAAVMDLLRSDTLDWEQYPIVYNNLYVDVDNWTPEEIGSFQDAIYKSEKDFHQVAAELGNRTVKQCVAFYYTWKKCCPDDYRKLRNLRRKRLLLEQQIDYTTFEAARQRTQSENPAETSDDDYSDGGMESDATSIASLSHFNRPSSPFEDTRGEKFPRMAAAGVTNARKNSNVRFGGPEPSGLGTSGTADEQSAMAAAMAAVMSNPSSSGQSAYPWLHGGGEFPSPASSATSVNNSYSQPPSVGSMAMDLFGNDASAGGPMPRAAAKPRGASGKKGAQPAADGFFHCRLCDKKFEKVKSLNAHCKSHAMQARAKAEAAAQLQHKQQQQQNQQSGFTQPQRNAPNGNERLPNDALLGFRADIDAQTQLQQQQQQAAFLRLIGAHSAFNTAAVSSAGGLNDALSMGQLTAAQLSAFTQPELSSVLAAMPQQPATTAAALEQLNFQNSATIMH